MVAVAVEVVKSWAAWSQLVVGMVAVQVLAAGLQLLSRVTVSNGTFIFALMAYRQAVAAFCVAPFAFYFERANLNMLRKLSVWLCIFFNALTGMTLAMSMYYYGLRDTTATYATNFLSLIPIVTFFLSCIFRIEELRLQSKSSQAKVAGALFCVTGALITTLYKGISFHPHMPHLAIHHEITKLQETKPNWAQGTLFLLGSCFSYSAWYMLQVKLHKVFPSKYFAMMITFIIAIVQSTIVGFCIDRRLSSWRLGWNMELLTIVYSGALATATTYLLVLWAITKRGPSYPTMFNPLALIFVAVFEALILGTSIRLGTILGMVLIIFGLYAFLWGKSKETKMKCLSHTNAVADESVAIEITKTNTAEATETIVNIGTPGCTNPNPS